MARRRPGFGPAVRATLWMAGLLVALMTGTLSAYLVLTALYAASKVYGLVADRRKGLGPGDASTE